MSMFLAAAAVLATQAPAPPLNVEIPELANVAPDPTCGGRAEMARLAFCLMTTQAAAETVVTAFTTAFQTQGWIAAGGGNNLVVYVKRKPEGGCDAFQMVAFTDEQRLPAPGAPAYLGLASIPGDICHARDAATPQ